MNNINGASSNHRDARSSPLPKPTPADKPGIYYTVKSIQKLLASCEQTFKVLTIHLLFT